MFLLNYTMYSTLSFPQPSITVVFVPSIYIVLCLWYTTTDIHRSGRLAGRVGSGKDFCKLRQVGSRILEIYFLSAGKFMRCDKNFFL